jgi:DNA-binding MarR family transcriptional regulator
MGPAPSCDCGPAVSRTAIIERMRGIARSVQALAAESAVRVGLNQSDLHALVRLVATDGLTATELGRTLGMTSSSITELADRLERDKMVIRTRSTSDRRLVVLKPTARGRRMVERAFGPTLASMAALLEELSDDELTVISGFLDEVQLRLAHASGAEVA